MVLLLLRLFSVSLIVFGMSMTLAAEVARAQFASDVVDREPIDDIGNRLKVEYGEIQHIYFFTDLRDMSGSRVSHRWLLNGESQAELTFDIGGDRWRVWSSKRLMPGLDGDWTVEIISDGLVIDSRSFAYVDE